jgi:hypothetical protein
MPSSNPVGCKTMSIAEPGDEADRCRVAEEVSGFQAAVDLHAAAVCRP